LAIIFLILAKIQKILAKIYYDKNLLISEIIFIFAPLKL